MPRMTEVAPPRSRHRAFVAADVLNIVAMLLLLYAAWRNWDYRGDRPFFVLLTALVAVCLVVTMVRLANRFRAR